MSSAPCPKAYFSGAATPQIQAPCGCTIQAARLTALLLSWRCRFSVWSPMLLNPIHHHAYHIFLMLLSILSNFITSCNEENIWECSLALYFFNFGNFISEKWHSRIVVTDYLLLGVLLQLRQKASYKEGLNPWPLHTKCQVSQRAT